MIKIIQDVTITQTHTHKLQAPIYDTLSTTVITGYAISLETIN